MNAKGIKNEEPDEGNGKGRIRKAAEEAKKRTGGFVKKHKSEIITGAVCALVASAGTALVLVRGSDIQVVQKITNGIAWKPVSTTINNVIQVKFGEPKGKAGIRLLCLENNKPYESIKEAAREMHISRDHLAKHASGELPDADGFHFINFGPAPVPEGATSPVAA